MRRGSRNVGKACVGRMKERGDLTFDWKSSSTATVAGEIEIKYWVDADDTEQDSEMRQSWT